MRPRLILLAVIATACLAGNASAQESVQPERVANFDSAAVRAPVVSTMDRPSEAVRRNAPALAAPIPASGQHLGEAKAEMAVGGAAIVVGALIGGDGGAVLMFGGAVVGLYGLWNYLR
jgi:hypothetical protein